MDSYDDGVTIENQPANPGLRVHNFEARFCQIRLTRIDEPRPQFRLEPNKQPMRNHVLWLPQKRGIARTEQNLNQNGENDRALAQVKKENEMLKLALHRANQRLGEEIVSDSDSSESDEEIYDNPVNTLYHETDSVFVRNRKYTFITNVSFFNYFFFSCMLIYS